MEEEYHVGHLAQKQKGLGMNGRAVPGRESSTQTEGGEWKSSTGVEHLTHRHVED